MEQIGTVIEKDGKYAVVNVKRTSSCGEACGSCGGCSPTSVSTKIINTIGAQVGDTVKFEHETGRVLFLSFLVYIVPIIAFIGGAVAVNFACGAAFFVIVLIILKIFDKKIGEKYIGIAVRIVDRKRNL